MTIKEIYANNHYDLLIKSNILNEDTDRDVFVKGYPFTLIDSPVSLRKFWEVCFDLRYVRVSFSTEHSKFSRFEKELHFIIENMMYLGNESDYNKKDIERCFKRYNIKY